MNRTDALYQSFLEILREELVPAMGCTVFRNSMNQNENFTDRKSVV